MRTGLGNDETARAARPSSLLRRRANRWRVVVTNGAATLGFPLRPRMILADAPRPLVPRPSHHRRPAARAPCPTIASPDCPRVTTWTDSRPVSDACSDAHSSAGTHADASGRPNSSADANAAEQWLWCAWLAMMLRPLCPPAFVRLLAGRAFVFGRGAPNRRDHRGREAQGHAASPAQQRKTTAARRPRVKPSRLTRRSTAPPAPAARPRSAARSPLRRRPRRAHDLYGHAVSDAPRRHRGGFASRRAVFLGIAGKPPRYRGAIDGHEEKDPAG